MRQDNKEKDFKTPKGKSYEYVQSFTWGNFVTRGKDSGT